MKVLLITKSYPPIASASGQIVFNIAKSLISRGFEVDVISRSIEPGTCKAGDIGETIYGVRKTMWEKLDDNMSGGKGKAFAIIRKIILATQIFRYPDSEYSVTKDIINLYNTKLFHNKYDVVITFFRPYSCVSAGIKIKQNSNARLITYILDLVEEKDRPTFMPQFLFQKLSERGELRYFDNSDLVVLPVSAQKVNSSIYSKYEDKIEYLEFPTYEPNEGKKTSLQAKNRGAIVFVFAGTLNQNYRNPKRFLKLIEALARKNKYRNYCIRFYGGGDCDEIIKSFDSTDNLSIEIAGRVKRDIIIEEYMSSDFLINIANSYAAVVPSKIFELFSTYKPIINVLSEADDGSLSYFERYPKCISVPYEEGSVSKDVVDSIDNFIENNYCVSCDKDCVDKAFHDCTPEYVVEKMVKRIK